MFFAMLNLGPKTKQWLAKIHVYSREDICRLGPCQVYRELLAVGYPPNLNLLYGLLGAAMDVDWKLIAEQYRSGQLDDVVASIQDLLLTR